ncbi:hypothetical protein BV22DRAFT_320853 [Leucogyrophana mollusca]|uniref:Uncharacterized protein n=1 Tax=Leucogyrophana mollusca TaxID=85980 RepID=A0ACB8BN37_9AGAM|nr:hypothetical protein BV22DRAFT_320853 [Leucogyrophana mollusca]
MARGNRCRSSSHGTRSSRRPIHGSRTAFADKWGLSLCTTPSHTSFIPYSAPIRPSWRDNTVEGDVDLLVFYTEVDEFEKSDTQERLQRFSDTYGGEMTPVIIVLTEIDDKKSLDDWRKRLLDPQPGSTVVTNATFTCYPRDGSAKESRTGQRLMRLIDERCLDTIASKVDGALKWTKFLKKTFSSSKTSQRGG